MLESQKKPWLQKTFMLTDKGYSDIKKSDRRLYAHQFFNDAAVHNRDADDY